MSSDSFEYVIHKLRLQITYNYVCLIYMYKENLALNNLQRFIYHKTQ